MVNRVVVSLLLAAFMIPFVGCNSQPAVMDYERLADSLRQGGITVETSEETFPLAGDDTRLVFSVKARNIEVNDENIHILEYRDEAKAEAETEIISPDGFSFSGKNFGVHVDWIAPPHFYQSGRIIVLYVGGNMTIIDLLNSILGPQFAGM